MPPGRPGRDAVETGPEDPSPPTPGRGRRVTRIRSGITARAVELERLHADVHRLWARRSLSADQWDAWAREADRFDLAVRDFYSRFDRAAKALRSGEPEEVETAVQFLEADPWCFRSGYMKAELMHRLANGPDLDAHHHRLHDVVGRRLTEPQPRLLRHTARQGASGSILPAPRRTAAADRRQNTRRVPRSRQRPPTALTLRGRADRPRSPRTRGRSVPPPGSEPTPVPTARRRPDASSFTKGRGAGRG
ncbi:hypothetical protein FMEAI12_5590018 [Parafrankia sp. Ea1.12]|nr:hypothetical protein FMEAI12_5590018 [Parafrankia sp. Ea1.12]